MLAVPDLITQLLFSRRGGRGSAYFQREGLDVTVEPSSPSPLACTYEALRDTARDSCGRSLTQRGLPFFHRVDGI